MTDLIPFEDIEIGEVFRSEPIAVTRESLIAFARVYDPQPFHLDERAGSASLLGGMAASGWHTAAVGMRLFYDCFIRRVASMGSPGFDEVRWLRPVRPGDRLSLILTIQAKRDSASRPDRGFVTTHLDIRNAADESVMTQRGPVMIQKRGASQPAATPLAPPAIGTTVAPPADLALTGFLDEVQIGHVSRLGAQLFTPDLITGFARLYDPQYFHVDAEAAKASPFGGLIASGWQTAGFWMRHYVTARDRSGEARRASALPVAVGGPSPGFTDIKWLRPVRAGETVHYGLEITGKRRAGRSGWGLVTTRSTGHSTDGALVFSFDGRLMWPQEPVA